MVNVLLSESKSPHKIIKRSDFLGKTALHMAASCGSSDTVRILLEHGAEPLRERDCDRRTALHYAAQAATGEEGITLAEILIEGCKSDQEKLLFLFASAAGLGTADQNLSDSVLKDYLLKEKQVIKDKVGTNNLLRTAACFGDIEMTKELLTRGCQLSDIHDQQWRNELAETQRELVDQVSSQLERFVDQGNDQPTTSDNLGRYDYARGLAALFLNPYLKSPIAVGISGSWGMGKSSLMIQTEVILLQTSAQLSFLPSPNFSNSASDIPGAKAMELSEKGKMKHRGINRQLDLLSDEQIQAKNPNEDSLVKFLDKYDVKYHDIFKSLAVMDKSDMVLSAINLVLAVCEINVILGMDKDLIERAIIKKYGDAKGKKSSKHNEELADMYIQKIIQLPLDLADPSKEESRSFLRGQLGVFETVLKMFNFGTVMIDSRTSRGSIPHAEIESESKKEINPVPDVTVEETPEEINSRTSRGSIPHAEIESESENEINPVPDVTVEETPEEISTKVSLKFPCYTYTHVTFLLKMFNLATLLIDSEIETESEKEINPSPDVAIEMQNTEEPTTQAPTETDPAVSLVIPTGAEATQGNYSNRGTSDEPTANTNRGIKSSVSLIPIRDILFVTYSEGEQDAFCYFQEMATECRKLPREWKRLLNYHRLVWYIFLISNQAKVLAAGWQVHLIAWIFVCWEWKDNMNFLIENWSEIGLPNIDSDSGGPSLLSIVEHLMEEHDQKADHPNRKDEASEKIQEVEGSVGKTGNIKETAPSSINEAHKLKDADADMMARIPKLEREMATSTDGSDGKETLGELKKEMKELRDQVSLELKELRDELKELRDHMVKKQSEKTKKKAEDKKIKMENIKNWKRMKTALE
ncbi:hypothetical protein KI387_023221, partial [Taxus chinensis]